MAATHAQLAQLSADPAFIARVRVGMAKIALAVYSEAANTPGHAARAAYARLVLNGPDAFAPRFALAVANQLGSSTFANESGIADAAIENGCSAAWNAMAGA